MIKIKTIAVIAIMVATTIAVAGAIYYIVEETTKSEEGELPSIPPNVRFYIENGSAYWLEKGTPVLNANTEYNFDVHYFVVENHDNWSENGTAIIGIRLEKNWTLDLYGVKIILFIPDNWMKLSWDYDKTTILVNCSSNTTVGVFAYSEKPLPKNIVFKDNSLRVMLGQESVILPFEVVWK